VRGTSRIALVAQTALRCWLYASPGRPILRSAVSRVSLTGSVTAAPEIPAPPIEVCVPTREGAAQPQPAVVIVSYNNTNIVSIVLGHLGSQPPKTYV
jgi:hypothetical protein